MSSVVPMFKEAPDADSLTPPDWIAEDWADFLESRREIKKPMTKVAQKRMLRKIARCESDYSRETIREMLDDSMVSGWQNIYPENYPKMRAADNAPQEPRRKPLSRQLIESQARPGESYEDAETRLRRERQ